MDKLFPIIRRKRRPLSVPDGPAAENPEMLKAEILKAEHLPTAVTPLVETIQPVPASVLEGPTTKPKKSRAGTTQI